MFVWESDRPRVYYLVFFCLILSYATTDDHSQGRVLVNSSTDRRELGTRELEPSNPPPPFPYSGYTHWRQPPKKSKNWKPSVIYLFSSFFSFIFHCLISQTGHVLLPCCCCCLCILVLIVQCEVSLSFTRLRVLKPLLLLLKSPHSAAFLVFFFFSTPTADRQQQQQQFLVLVDLATIIRCVVESSKLNYWNGKIYFGGLCDVLKLKKKMKKGGWEKIFKNAATPSGNAWIMYLLLPSESLVGTLGRTRHLGSLATWSKMNGGGGCYFFLSLSLLLSSWIKGVVQSTRVSRRHAPLSSLSLSRHPEATVGHWCFSLLLCFHSLLLQGLRMFDYDADLFTVQPVSEGALQATIAAKSPQGASSCLYDISPPNSFPLVFLRFFLSSSSLFSHFHSRFT